MEYGYICDKRFALHDVDDEQKDGMLTYHSEKIAVAFGLLSIIEGSTVRVLKNLRVCGVWHSAIKLIMKIIRQMVVLRDSISSLQGWVLFLQKLLVGVVTLQYFISFIFCKR